MKRREDAFSGRLWTPYSWASRRGILDEGLCARGYRRQTKLDFGEPYGRRTVLHYAFPDQYTLPQNLPIESATSWLCMGSAPMTRFFGLLRQVGLSVLFRNRSFLGRFA